MKMEKRTRRASSYSILGEPFAGWFEPVDHTKSFSTFLLADGLLPSIFSSQPPRKDDQGNTGRRL